MRSYIFASCDEKYFMDHGYHFASSANKQGVRAWIDIISPDPYSFLNKVKLPSFAKITFTESKETDRTFYACNRFLVANKVLQSADQVLITDVDTLCISVSLYLALLAGKKKAQRLVPELYI